MDVQKPRPMDIAMKLLRAGTLPGPQQSADLQNHILSTATYIRTIVAQITATQSTADKDWQYARLRLIQLAAIRRDLNNTMAILRSVLSPVRRLPPEILMEIFRLCVDTTESPLGQDVPRSYYCLKRNEHLAGPHWTLSHVCSYWRDVAISMPSLWSTLDIALFMRGPNDALKWDRAQEATKTYLDRAGNFPLTLSIDAADRNIDTHLGLDIIASHCHHWGNVTLRIPSGLYESIVSRVMRNLPMLRSLVFAPSNPNDFTSVDMFIGAPMLREVDLRLPASMFILPWEQLTHMTLRVRLTTLQELFRTAHTLTNAVIHGTSTASQLLSPRLLPIHFPVLHELDVGDGFDILPLMNAPALQSITVMNMDLADSNILLSFLTRSSISLKRLTSLGMRMSVTQFLRVLGSLPDVEHLDARDRELFTDEFFQRLTFTAHRTQLLPRLKSVMICDASRRITPALLRFLESRSPHSGLTKSGRAHFASVHLEMSVPDEGGFIYNVKSVITSLREQGVAVSGRYTSYGTTI